MPIKHVVLKKCVTYLNIKHDDNVSPGSALLYTASAHRSTSWSPKPWKRFFILKLLSFYNLVLTHAKLQHMSLIPHMLINIH